MDINIIICTKETIRMTCGNVLKTTLPLFLTSSHHSAGAANDTRLHPNRTISNFEFDRKNAGALELGASNNETNITRQSALSFASLFATKRITRSATPDSSVGTTKTITIRYL
jgi:hypothetical protein